jgi:thioredoxin reductase/NAD-dependent dihydropyrimidine dehydrogenase PreA subunit
MSESVITVLLAIVIFAIVFIPYYYRTTRKSRLYRAQKHEAMSLGRDKPVAQHPLIDQSKCIGCAACVIACPEHALGIIDGIAELVHPAKCVGHGLCAEACPVSGIKIVLDPTKSTAELPILTEQYESNISNLFLVGELGGMALIRNAIFQGRSVIDLIAERLPTHPGPSSNGRTVFDVVVVGAGPAGLSAALQAMQCKLDFVLLEKEPSPGGAILSYPRQKLVMTVPVEIPKYGRLKKRELSKEELLDMWEEIIRNTGLQVQCGEKLVNVTQEDQVFRATTAAGHEFLGKFLVLALGRRGTPRKLGVPGENSPKVAYQLLEAVRYKHSTVAVAGAGDSALEAAIALSKQEGTAVTLINRGDSFDKAKPKNQERIREAEEAGKVQVFYQSQVFQIEEKTITVNTPGGTREIPNDYVFVFAGGELPTPFLKKIGIEFAQKQKMIA